MSEFTINDVEKEELTADMVGARCQSYEFAGKKLKPFSKSRQTAAALIGVTPFIGGDEEDRRANLSLDMQKVLWLCSVDDAMVLKVTAQRKVALPLVVQWWEKHGCTIGSAEWIAALETCSNIIEDIETVSATVDGTGSSSDSDSLGE